MAIQINNSCMFCDCNPCTCAPVKPRRVSKIRATSKPERVSQAVKPVQPVATRASLTRTSTSSAPVSQVVPVTQVIETRPPVAQASATRPLRPNLHTRAGLTRTIQRDPLADLDDETVVCLHVLAPILHTETKYNLRSVLDRELTADQNLILWRKTHVGT